MASSCTVKILEIEQIKPSPESPNSSIESSLPLTFFDTYWFKLSPVERLLFYQLDSSIPALFSSEIIPQLKRSLSLTLNHYLPIVEDLKWPSNVVCLCVSSNNGIPKENASLRRFVEQVTSGTEVMVKCVESDDFGCKEWVKEQRSWLSA